MHAYNCTYNLPVVIVRPFNNYGPKQHLEKLIPRLITSAIQGKPLTIHGTGEQKRDWVNVKDVCIALDKILNLQDFSIVKGQEINIGTGKGISVLEIANMVRKYFNLPEAQLKFIGDRPGQVDTHIASFEKARFLLGWASTIDFEKGLESTIKWYIDNPSYWRKLEDSARIPIKAVNNQIELQ
ncbi:MAG: dTDP-glucose 4,6-dehydratase [Chlamydiae bacterium]|nr:dTDP-glucose 4,6-dehydratase [Chlamydiota bacterium]